MTYKAGTTGIKRMTRTARMNLVRSQMDRMPNQTYVQLQYMKQDVLTAGICGHHQANKAETKPKKYRNYNRNI